MSFASSNRMQLHEIEETVFGTTPTTPAFTSVRHTSESLNYNLSNIVSEEIRSDRMTADLVQVQSDASGDMNFEMSYGAFDSLFKGSFASDWSADIGISGASDISASSAGTYASTTTDFTTSIVVGQWVKVTGFTNSENNGYHHVTAVATNLLTVSETDMVTESAAGSSGMTGSMIRNGTTLRSYSLQKVLQDATAPVYMTFNGTRIGQTSFDIQVGQIVTGSIGVMALGQTASTTQISGATILPASNNEVMNAVSNVLDIREDDVASTSFFSTLSIAITNNLRAQDAVGTLPHVGIALGRLEVTGGINLYFEDLTMYNRYLNATAFSLSFRMQDASGKSYIVTIPKVKFEGGGVASGGLDQDIFLDATWRALLDTTTSSMVQMDRFV